MENKTTIKPDESQIHGQTVDKSRRSFAKAGVAAPVLMTLAGRPALGAGAVCTVSGYISATPTNVSGINRHVAVNGCGGLSPGAYATPYSGDGVWTATPWAPGGRAAPKNPEAFGRRGTYGTTTIYGTYGTTMSVAFGYAGLNANVSMYDVIWMKGGAGDPYQLGAHLVAALLNAASGLYSSTNGLTVANVQAMYYQLSSKGTFTAAPGVEWDKPTVVAFIAQTFHTITAY